MDKYLVQQAIRENAKVYTEFSPYFFKDTQIGVSTIEQVVFYHRKLIQPRVLGEFVKDNKETSRKRKRIIKDLLKFWDKDFKKNMDVHKQMMLHKTPKIKRKKVKKIHYGWVYSFIVICVGTIFLSKTLNESTVNKLLLSSLIYVSLIASLYIMILNNYFDVLIKLSQNSEKLITNEFKVINRNFSGQQKALKRHLMKSLRKSYKQKYHIKNIFDPNMVIEKLNKYSYNVDTKVVDFQKKYHLLLLLVFLLKVIVLSLTCYLGFIYLIK